MNDTSKKEPVILKALCKTRDFFKKHIKAVYITITVLLVFLLFSALSTKLVFNVVTVDSIEGEELNNLLFLSYDTSITENGNVLYTPNDIDPMILFNAPQGASFNAVTVYFKESVSVDQYVELFYSVHGEGFTQDASKLGALASNRTQVTAYISESTYTFMRLDINDEFTLDRIAFETRYLEYDFGTANIVCAILFVLSIVALIIFERKFKYFAFIKGLLIGAFNSCKELFKAKAYVRFAVRILAILSISTLCVSAFVLLALTKISTGIIVYVFIISLLAVGFFIADRIMSDNISAPILFLVITLICGFMLSFCLPPTLFNSWDEAYHFDRCVDLRCMLFNSEKTSSDCYHSYANVDMYFEDIYGTIVDLVAFDQVPVTTPDSTVQLYKSVGYIPSSIAMFICDIVDLNFFVMIVFAKMANILTYAFVIYAGIKRLKSGQLLFSSVCLLPTALFITASFSYDYFVTAFVAFGYAYFISELQRPNKLFTIKDGVLMLGSMVLACGPKAIYFALILPMLFMGGHKFSSKKAHKIYKIACVVAMVIALMSFVIPFITDTDASSDLRGGADVNALEQVKFILKNPIKYAKILIKFMGEYVSFSTASVYAGSYAYIGFSPSIYGSLGLGIIIFCTFLDRSEHDLFPRRKRLKALTLFISFAQIALVATALYVSFTPVAHTTINGCQWRYIIPVLIPFLYCIGSSKIKHTINDKFLNGVVYGALALNLFASIYEVYISKIFLLNA